MLVVVSLFALSFGLLRKACLTDDDSGFLWAAAGLYVLVGTIGAAIERLIAPRRSGIVAVVISIVVVSLIVWFLYILGGKMAALSHVFD
jgi:hypothetical protein